MTRGTDVVTREELYELVWLTPMIRVAEKFEVSGSYLARVCTELRVPPGFWGDYRSSHERVFPVCLG